jgi:hypothetical protein
MGKDRLNKKTLAIALILATVLLYFNMFNLEKIGILIVLIVAILLLLK